MAKIISREQLLADYPKIENVDELFDSDVLILPNDKIHGRFLNQRTTIPGLKTKAYHDPKEPLHSDLSANAQQVFDLGEYVFSAINLAASLVTIMSCFKKDHEDREISFNNYIEIQNAKTINNYLVHPYKGIASDIDPQNELADIKKELADIKKDLENINSKI